MSCAGLSQGYRGDQGWRAEGRRSDEGTFQGVSLYKSRGLAFRCCCCARLFADVQGFWACCCFYKVSALSRGAVFTSVLFTPERAICCVWRRSACCSQRREHVGHWGVFATQTTSVGEVSGDAHLAVVRGSRRVFFDMKCSVKFNISCSSGGALGLPPESSAVSESLGSYESKGKTTALSSSSVVVTASFAVCIKAAVRRDRMVHSRTALGADGCRSCSAALVH